MKNLSYKIIVLGIVLGFVFTGQNSYAQGIAGMAARSASTGATIARASVGHVVIPTDNPKKNADNKAKIKGYDAKYNSTQAYYDYKRARRDRLRRGGNPREKLMTRTEFANSNLRNKAIADLYNQAGVTSVRNFDSGEEILTGNSLPNFALPGFDGTMPAHYYFDGDLDKNPVEATTVYGLDNWKKVVTKHPQTGEPMPFSAFVNKKTGEMFVYYKALTGSMFRHEYAHQKIMEYVANNPVTGENSLNRLQIDFANLTNLVYATGDPKAISAFEGYVNHIVYRSLLHGWSDEDLQRVGLYNLGGKQLMDRLTSSSSLASFNDTVFHEFVANVNGLIADPNFKNQLLDSFDRAERAFFYNDTTNGDMESGHVLMKARRFMTDTTSRQTAIDRFIDSFHDKIKMPVDFGELSKFKNQNY